MYSILFIILFYATLFIVGFLIKKLIFTKHPKKQWEDSLHEFNNNLKQYDEIISTNYYRF